MNSRALLGIVALLLIGAGVYYYFAIRPGAPLGTVATSTPSGSSSSSSSSSSSGGGSTSSGGASPEALCVAAGGTFNPSVNECVLPLIIVNTPVANALVASPLTVSGKARGYWYFEASFPIEVTDQSGKILAQSHAEAQSEWMTTEFVPFTGRLTFTVPTSTTRGFIIFRKDNPSGLPENDASVSVPVRFR